MPSEVTVLKVAALSFARGAGASGFGATIAARVFLDASRGIDELLFPGEKRMAGGADANFNVLLGGAGVVDSTARAGDVGLEILWMNVRFHVWKRVANLGALLPPRKG